MRSPTQLIVIFVRVLTVLFSFEILPFANLFGADGIDLELMASRVSAIDGEFTGHAFMCIKLHLNSGIKEDCYGFYPKTGGLKGYVGGPGVVTSEFRKNPLRFSRVEESLQIHISEDQRRAILNLVNRWDDNSYDLTSQQCVDFIRSVSETAGLRLPPRSTFDLPVDFLKKLKRENP